MKSFRGIAAMGLATALFSIDISIVNIALPSIQDDFHTNLIALRWVIDIFAIFLVSLLIPLGLFSRRIGEKIMFYASLSLFMLGCLLAGLAHHFALLLIARAIQGIALAALFPTTLALTISLYSSAEKNLAISFWSAISGIGLALGPVLGGLIVHITSWRWVFLMNIPVCCLAILLSLGSLAAPQTDHHSQHKIYPDSMLLLILAVACSITAILDEPILGIHSPWIYSLLLLSVGFFVTLYHLETHRQQPMINLNCLKHPRYLKASCLTFVNGFSFYTALFIIPLFMSNVMHHSSLFIGFMMLPLSASTALAARFTARCIEKIGNMATLYSGIGLFLLGTLMLLHLNMHPYHPYLIIALTIYGLGWGLTYSGGTSYALSVIPAEEITPASSLFITIRNFGGGIGLAITGALAYHRHDQVLHSLPKHLQHSNWAERYATVQGFHAVIWLLATLVFLSGIILLWRNKKAAVKTA
jgi:DHA2 family methylenomycin A resistance protein-like MFS transporter